MSKTQKGEDAQATNPTFLPSLAKSGNHPYLVPGSYDVTLSKFIQPTLLLFHLYLFFWLFTIAS